MANLSWDITGLSTDAWLFARRRLLRRSWARSLTRVPLAKEKVTASRYSLLCKGQTAGAAVVWTKQGNHVANVWVRSGKIERTAEETLSQIASVEPILSLLRLQSVRRLRVSIMEAFVLAAPMQPRAFHTSSQFH